MSRCLIFILCVCTLSNVIFSQTSSVVKGPDRYSEEEIDLQNLYIQANQKQLLAKYEDAAEIYQKILEKSPLNAPVYYELARVLLNLEKYNEAIASGKKAVQYDPNNVWYLLTLSDIYGRSEDYTKQAQTLEKVVKTNEDESLYDRLGKSWVAAGNYPQALAAYQQAMSRYGMSEYWVDASIDVYLQSNDVKNAEKFIKEYIKADASDLDRLLKLGEFYMFVGKKSQAKETFESILAQDNKNEGAAFNLAMIQRNSSEGNSNNLEQIINDDRLDMDFKIQTMIPLVMRFAKEDNFDPAVASQLQQLGSQLIAQYPDQAKVYALQGDILFTSNEIEKSIDLYQKALSYDKSIYQIWDQIMKAYMLNRNMDELSKFSMQAIDYYPNQSGPYYYHAYASFENGNKKKAREYLDEAIFISTPQDPNAEPIIVLMAHLTYDSGDLIGSIDLLQSFIAKNDHSATALELLGDLMKAQGNKVDAEKYWNQAIQNGGDKTRITQKIQSI
jgi:tetratricopeptide (TPR) repeat protein